LASLQAFDVFEAFKAFEEFELARNLDLGDYPEKPNV
jgi:hypothetical protein